MLNRRERPLLVPTFVAATVAFAVACTSESDLGDHGSNASPSDPAASGDPNNLGGPDTSTDGGPDPATTKNDAGKNTPKDPGTKSTSDGSTTPPPATCSGSTFQVGKVVPMPSGYVVAGYHPYYGSFLFTNQASPRKVFRHKISDVQSGNLQVLDDGSYYHPEEVIGAIAGSFSSTVGGALRITKVTNANGTFKYLVREDSDTNLRDYTGNLPALDAGSRISSLYYSTPGVLAKTGFFVVRAGAEVYTKGEAGTTWSLVANLSGSGTTGWEGLAVEHETTNALRFFFKATLPSGQHGIIEQRWPNALASDAEAPSLVFANADATPFGVSEDGCTLYASRLNGATLEVVFYTR